jgi:hypothetical protein
VLTEARRSWPVPEPPAPDSHADVRRGEQAETAALLRRQRARPRRARGSSSCRSAHERVHQLEVAVIALDAKPRSSQGARTRSRGRTSVGLACQVCAGRLGVRKAVSVRCKLGALDAKPGLGRWFAHGSVEHSRSCAESRREIGAGLYDCVSSNSVARGASTAGSETAAFIEEQQSGPALPPLVRMERLAGNNQDARLSARVARQAGTTADVARAGFFERSSGRRSRRTGSVARFTPAGGLRGLEASLSETPLAALRARMRRARCSADLERRGGRGSTRSAPVRWRRSGMRHRRRSRATPGRRARARPRAGRANGCRAFGMRG